MHKAFRFMVVVWVFSAFTTSSAGQSPALKNVMREKLSHAQQVLEAVVVSDWAALQVHSRELQRLTEDSRWTALQYPEYARYSSAFRRSVKDLETAAAKRDLEDAPKAYVAMTLQCVDCHRYLARARMVN